MYCPAHCVERPYWAAGLLLGLTVYPYHQDSVETTGDESRRSGWLILLPKIISMPTCIITRRSLPIAEPLLGNVSRMS